MSKDRSGRKAYRKSPGRQYGYEYDPLRNQTHSDSSPPIYRGERSRPSLPDERQATYEDSSSSKITRQFSIYNEQDTQSAPRPDPRRTRQLLRQNILASKSKTALPGEQTTDEAYDQQDITNRAQIGYEELEDTARHPHGNVPVRTRSLAPRRSIHLDREAEEEEEWEEPDPDYRDSGDSGENLLQHRLRYSRHLAPIERRGAVRRYDPAGSPPQRSLRRSPIYRGIFNPRGDDDSNYTENIADPVYRDSDEQERPRARRKAKRNNVTRRRLLLGLGSVVVGGAAAAVAAYELPKVPQVLNDVGKNIEQRLEAAFNQGFEAGANAVRKEFITGLDNLEGVSLDAAMSAAKLTRVAYDVFVSPLVKFLADVAGDFLNVTLRALIQGRHWLSNIGQDNDTLAGLQQVLETWVQQDQQMPKQIQAVADADLDGAQSYLRALRRKIDAEQAKLNAQNTTPTAAPTATPTAKPKSL